MVVLRGTAAPVLLKWFLSRDVSTGAPFSNGTIIPIPISSFPLLIYLHSRKFLRSADGDKSRVLIRANRPTLVAATMGRIADRMASSLGRNALFLVFVPLIHFFLLHSKADYSYLESFCGVLCVLFFRTFFLLPRDRSRKHAEGKRAARRKENEQGRNEKMKSLAQDPIEASTPFRLPDSLSNRSPAFHKAPPLPKSRQRIALGYDYYQKWKMNMAHGGVCIFLLGVLLSCEPRASWPTPPMFTGGRREL